MASLVAGIDEVGRGCIAGPVIAAAVIFAPGQDTHGLADSKRLRPDRRLVLAGRICSESLAWAVGRAEVSEIDQLNILRATHLAMCRAVAALPVLPDWVRVDGNRYPPLDCPGEAIVGGDASVAEIAAASILAKVFRDREMEVLDRLCPGYALGVHKGYPTRLHIDRLASRGASFFHRRSFAPVRAVIDRSSAS
ncbi:MULTISPECIES: ribonuclease HII [Methylococcus]|uniref:Ribonuclease HII n=1 Tax=Methylococcus capsulatus (strain ATCC 33009 / NCIMB 11132 / Bath) TaxID=243233 RepID=RNH2_METCA|nr:ribonuclease HII [Methylococcus capsulatus]Q604U3.1 RecName: Full=Ribonuclease HII; Short=RNase HII [Methylococcus capsulatus str. Bath]AAU91448.1 ribonuclease HII [Methylococcus capsulatus str. Bath]